MMVVVTAMALLVTHIPVVNMEIIEQCEAVYRGTTFEMSCPTEHVLVVTTGICVRVTSCDAFNTSLAESCNGNKTVLWAKLCSLLAPEPCAVTCTGSLNDDCPGDQSYAYVEYHCQWNGNEESTTNRPTLDMNTTQGTSTQGTTTQGPTTKTDQLPQEQPPQAITTQGMQGTTTQGTTTQVTTTQGATTQGTTTRGTTTQGTIHGSTTHGTTTQATTIHGSTTQVSQPRNQHTKSSLFTAAKDDSEHNLIGYCLTGHVMEVVQMVSQLRCAMMCNDNVSCRSFNYVKIGGVCELNGESSEGAESEYFTRYEGCTYFGRV